MCRLRVTAVAMPASVKDGTTFLNYKTLTRLFERKVKVLWMGLIAEGTPSPS